jgi:hypothetical protein
MLPPIKKKRQTCVYRYFYSVVLGNMRGKGKGKRPGGAALDLFILGILYVGE